MTPERPSVGERLYRLLLSFYPDAFLDRFEPQLLEAFREERRDQRYDGPLGGIRFWGMILWDLVRTLREARRTYVTRTPGHSATEETRAIGWEAVVDGVRQDLKFALRTLLRAPGFALMAILTLAIGIGANAAIFSVVNSVLLKPLPYGESERVVTIWSQWRGFPKTWVSAAEYQAYVSLNRTMEDITLWGHNSVTFTSPENPERVGSAFATPNLPSVLGVAMERGRFFTEEEGIYGNTNPSETIVLSHDAWVRRYSADPAIVGSRVEVNGRDREVIGVLPEGFQLPTDFGSGAVTDVYFPGWIARDEPTSYPGGGGSHGFHMAGRLLPGVSVEEARADLHRIIDQIHAEFGAYPEDRAFSPLLYSATQDIVGDLRPAILALLGTVAFVLLIACANVANLLLTRSQIRHNEISVRAALGAGRGRIVRQMLTEGLVLGVIGCGLGLGLAYGGVELFKGLNPGNLPRVDEIAVDGTVVGFSLLVTLATVLFFGGLPALRTVRSDLRSGLGQRTEGGVGRSGWQGTLVAAEMALAVVLVIGAGLMVRTFSELSSIDTGFEGESVLSLAVSLPTTTYPTAQDLVNFHNEAMRQIDELPGVDAVGGARILPLASQIGDWGLMIENYEAPPTLPVNGDWQFAAPGYFEIMGIPLLEGRTFAAIDDAEGTGVMVVNEAFVRHFWPEGNPNVIGQRVAMRAGQPEPTWMTIVGVVGDVTHNGITAEIKRKFYVPMAQWNMASGNLPTSMRYVVKTAGRPEAMAGPVRSVVRRLDPSLAVAQVQTVEEIKSAAVAQPRFTVVLMGAFSAIAIVLAMIGIYGVISYGVTQRFQEIGIRMALGAQREQVVGLMLRKGITMVIVGLAVGLGIALGMTRYLESLLYDVSATDPVTFGVVGVTFAAVAWLATWIPSRRAARVDPIRALKTE